MILGQSSRFTATDGSFELPSPKDPGADSSQSLQINCEGFAPKFIELKDHDVNLGNIELKRPNFILIVSDDQGWAQTSTQMDPDDPETKSDYFRTPNMDSFF